MRLAPTALVLALLAATAAAFAVAERLKLEASPVLGPKLDRFLSPRGGRTAELQFRLARRDRVTVTVLDPAGQTVRTLADAKASPRGRVTLRWDGKTDAGEPVAEGTYRYVVRLAAKRRTVQLPFGVRVDRTAPTLRIVSALPASLPAGQGTHAGRVKIRYRLSERARPELFLRGRRVVRARRQRPRGQLDWYARSSGKALPPGTHRLILTATDEAGNRSRPATVTVTIRPRA